MREMFCFQCQQTAHNTGCDGKAGVCGKSADTGLTGTGSAVRRLLALKTKHLFVHFRTLSSLDVISMDGLAGLYTGRTRGVFSASIRGGAPLAGRAWNVR